VLEATQGLSERTTKTSSVVDPQSSVRPMSVRSRQELAGRALRLPPANDIRRALRRDRLRHSGFTTRCIDYSRSPVATISRRFL